MVISGWMMGWVIAVLAALKVAAIIILCVFALLLIWSRFRG